MNFKKLYLPTLLILFSFSTIYAQSISELEKHLKELSSTDRNAEKLGLHIRIARFYKSDGKERKATNSYEEAEKLFGKNLATPEQKIEVYKALSELYNKGVSRKKSNYYLELLAKVQLAVKEGQIEEKSAVIQKRDSLVKNLANENQIKSLENELQMEQIELLERSQLISRLMLFEDSLKITQKNAVIKEKDAQTELEREKRKQTQSIALGIAGVLGLSIFLFISKVRSGRIIAKEKKKSDDLLLNILPVSIAEELKKNGKVEPQKHPDATVMFSDFVGFSKVAEVLNQRELVTLIDEYFFLFDDIMKVHGIEKIKTIGDAYMCVAGVPNADVNHAQNMMKASIEIQKKVLSLKREKIANNQPYFELRIGIQSGEVIAGVVGKSKYAYDIWGESVNLASRIESVCPPGSIAISKKTAELLKGEFELNDMMVFDVKNTKNIQAHFHHINLDVFEEIFEKVDADILKKLPSYLSYHNREHTLEVVAAIEKLALAEKIEQKQIVLLKLAALFHDTGFISSPKFHEKESVALAKQYLEVVLSAHDLKIVSDLIMATERVYEPKTLLEKIMKDADLSYLGLANYSEKAAALKQELTHLGNLKADDNWKEMQVDFLKNHRFYTAHAENNWQGIKDEIMASLVG
jgi:class 3 adenylate cyclase/predicted metal-dependent HD superfamily phosphohydrolase